jgi:SAM-dependent methyltransferase
VTRVEPVPTLHWVEKGATQAARWLSHSDAPPPVRVVAFDGQGAGASMTADEVYGLACQGTAILWRGDFQEARQMLTALKKRAERPQRKLRQVSRKRSAGAEAFHLYRQANAQRARTLNSLLIPLDADWSIPLRRAPDLREACREAWGEARTASVASLRALLGVIGAHEWRVQGIEIPEAGGRIHPHFGVFAPIRREYIDLVSAAPLPERCDSGVAFDIGTGTGVLAAVLARRGVARVVATDVEPRALECARENVERLGLVGRVEIVEADLFPEGRAALVVCNPPWIPARPSSPMERGVYDEDGGMLRGFLRALPSHLEPGGEGWLILSDLAEHLGLRSRADLLAQFDAAGLRVVGKHDVPARHARAADETDALFAARAAEITSLWRLAAR